MGVASNGFLSLSQQLEKEGTFLQNFIFFLWSYCKKYNSWWHLTGLLAVTIYSSDNSYPIRVLQEALLSTIKSMPLNSLEESEITKEATEVLLKVSKLISFRTMSCYSYAEQTECRLHQCRTGKNPNNLLNSCKVSFCACQITQTPVDFYAWFTPHYIIHINCTGRGLLISTRLSDSGCPGFIFRSGNLLWLRYFVVFLTPPDKCLRQGLKSDHGSFLCNRSTATH